MAMAKIPNIAYEIEGDYINLEQDAGCGEMVSIQVHRTQLEYIAGKMGIPTLDASAKVIRRRFETVKDRLIELAGAEHYRKEIIERCGSGIEFIIELDAACDLAEGFLE